MASVSRWSTTEANVNEPPQPPRRNHHSLSAFGSSMVKKTLSDLGGLVYSTEVGRTCPVCRQAIAECVCHTPKRPMLAMALSECPRETKGRAGKGVTLVKGVPLDDDELMALGKKLKAACGSGGTVKDGVIEVQGDHVEKVMSALVAQGFTVKRAGG